MRTRRGAAAGIAVLAVAALAMGGGDYEITAGTVGGGGGSTSSGGAYRLGGTAGQAITIPASGGAYALHAGFWTPIVTGVVAIGDPAVPDAPLPARFRVRPPAPNPFRGATAIAFELPEPGRVVLAIYDVDGRLVRRVDDTARAAGRYRAYWDGQDEQGRSVAPGVYFVRLDAGDAYARFRLVRLE